MSTGDNLGGGSTNTDFPVLLYHAEYPIDMAASREL